MRLPFALGFVMVLALGNAGRGASFTGISSFGTTYAQRISADGSTVVGRIEDANGIAYPLRWSATNGASTLDHSFGGRAFAVSANGGVIGGYVRSRFSSNTDAAHWQSPDHYLTTTTAYDSNTGIYANFSQIDALSFNGGIGVGYGTFPIPIVEDVEYTQAVVYYPIENYGPNTLGDLSGGDNYSKARDVTPDGSTIVGLATSALGREAFRSSQNYGSMVGLGDLPGGAYSSEARSVSANGAIIVGAATSAAGPEAFRWTESGGMVGLGDLPGGAYSSSAWGVSADGTKIVGEGRTAAGRTAFLWDDVHGMRDLNRVLTDDYGVDLRGWHLSQAASIDASGKIITGNGVNPEGESQAWVVDLNQRLRFTPSDYSNLFSYEPSRDWSTWSNNIYVSNPQDSGAVEFTAETPFVRSTNPDAFEVQFLLTTNKAFGLSADNLEVDIIAEDGRFVAQLWSWFSESEEEFDNSPIRAQITPGVLTSTSRYKVRIRYSDRDINFSLGPLTISNLELLEAELALSVTGDADGDGDVDLTDLNHVRNNFGASGAGIQGDTNGDQLVDLVDLNNVRNHFGEGSSVPEPSAIAMLLVSACALAAGRLAGRKK